MLQNDIYLDIRINNLENILKEKDNINYKALNEYDETFLHYAVKCNSYECVRFFLKYINVNSVNKSNETALFYACKMGKLELVKLLIRNKIDINITNDLGETALNHALIKGDIDIIKYLLDNNATYTHLTKDLKSISYYAVIGGYNVFTYLHKKGIINIYELDNSKNTLLHIGCKTHNIKLIKYLLKYINPNQKNINKETPLFNAIRNNYPELISLLVKNGAIIDLKNKYQESILDLSNDKNYLLELMDLKDYRIREKKYPQIIAIIKEDMDYLRNNVIKNVTDNYNLSCRDYAKLVLNDEIIKLIK